MVTVGLIALGACSEEHGNVHAEHDHPATVEPIAGSAFARLTLTERAVERLGIEVAEVTESDVVRRRQPGGEVIAVPEGRGAITADDVAVRVKLSARDVAELAKGEPARVMPLVGGSAEAGLVARPFETVTGTGALYYLVEGGAGHFELDQRVRVDVALDDGGAERLAVPYGALVYGPHGDTWVYTNPQPLTFVREAVSVAFIHGDQAILDSGPAVGTRVATVGVAQLYGEEIGIGH